ncbi:hypothetical protein BKA93DRAFT_258125 [Sparassis latifolia]
MFGSFSNPNTSSGSAFGNQQPQQAGTSNAVGLLGAPPAAPGSTSLFGGSAPQTGAGSNPLLGGNQGTSQSTAGGLFGNSANQGGGGLFGGTNMQNRPAAGAGLFGATSGTSSGNPLLGTAPQNPLGGTGTSPNPLFATGGSNTGTTGGGLFGNTPVGGNTAPAGGGLFGNPAGGSNTNTTGGLFGNAAGGSRSNTTGAVYLATLLEAQPGQRAEDSSTILQQGVVRLHLVADCSVTPLALPRETREAVSSEAPPIPRQQVVDSLVPPRLLFHRLSLAPLKGSSKVRRPCWDSLPLRCWDNRLPQCWDNHPLPCSDNLRSMGHCSGTRDNHQLGVVFWAEVFSVAQRNPMLCHPAFSLGQLFPQVSNQQTPSLSSHHWFNG